MSLFLFMFLFCWLSACVILLDGWHYLERLFYLSVCFVVPYVQVFGGLFFYCKDGADLRLSALPWKFKFFIYFRSFSSLSYFSWLFFVWILACFIGWPVVIIMLLVLMHILILLLLVLWRLYPYLMRYCGVCGVVWLLHGHWWLEGGLDGWDPPWQYWWSI